MKANFIIIFVALVNVTQLIAYYPLTRNVKQLGIIQIRSLGWSITQNLFYDVIGHKGYCNI